MIINGTEKKYILSMIYFINNMMNAAASGQSKGLLCHLGSIRMYRRTECTRVDRRGWRGGLR
jgi:hypothetical protein